MPPQLPLAATIFPGRTVLTPSEVAKALRCTETHIKDLIDEGRTSSHPHRKPRRTRYKAPRQCLRIPISSYDSFLRARAG